jgi:hypothetical protein
VVVRCDKRMTRLAASVGVKMGRGGSAAARVLSSSTIPPTPPPSTIHPFPRHRILQFRDTALLLFNSPCRASLICFGVSKAPSPWFRLFLSNPGPIPPPSTRDIEKLGSRFNQWELQPKVGSPFAVGQLQRCTPQSNLCSPVLLASWTITASHPLSIC